MKNIKISFIESLFYLWGKNMTNQSERLKNLVAKMALKNSYWGYLFARVRRVASDQLPSIMGVAPLKDGTVALMYHPELVATTKDDALKHIIEHEGMHLLNKHLSRLLRIISNEVDENMKGAKITTWNIAADCAVNTLTDMPKELEIGGRPTQGCFPELYDMPDKKASEYYFNKLMKKVKFVKIGKGGSETKDGSEGLDEVFDKIGDHSEWGNISKQTADVSSLSRKIDSYVNEIIKDSAKNFEKKRGHLPGYIRELIDEALAPPKVPYYQIIQKLVKGSRLSKFKRAFTKVNRKRTYAFAIGDDQNIPQISPFPGRTRDFSFVIAVVIDTSGSMTPDDIKEGLSGIKNIIENDRHCKTHVIEVDTAIGKEYEVKRVRDIEYEITGRGGTCIFPGLERAKELKPDVVLCFTDGYCENINDIPRKDLPRKTIYVIQDDGTADYVNQTGYIVRI